MFGNANLEVDMHFMPQVLLAAGLFANACRDKYQYDSICVFMNYIFCCSVHLFDFI